MPNDADPNADENATVIDDEVAEPIPDADLPAGESLAGRPKAPDDVKVPAPGGEVPKEG